MSNFKTVSEFLHAVPKAIRHAEIYRDYLGESIKQGTSALDLCKWEFSLIGHGEKNLLRDVVMPDKFLCDNFDEGFQIQSKSFAKQQGSVAGKGSMSGERTYDESFLMEETMYLCSSKVCVADSRRPGVQIPENEALYRQLMAAVAGARGSQLSGVALTFVSERLTMRSDLRRIFLKGYLILQSYNLAITSKRYKYGYSDMSVYLCTDAQPENRVVKLMRNKIVVSAEHFSEEELWLLVEMCNEYPLIRFGPGNIYNNIYIDADDLVVFGEQGYTMEHRPGYGSPERIWNNLVNIAMKLDALEDLAEVIRDFRGMPALLRYMQQNTGRNQFNMVYPYSYSIKSGVESSYKNNPVVTRHSGYFATSKSLVVDLMLGEMMLMSVYNIVEELGAFGPIGVPSGDIASDELFGSNLRNWGIKSEAEDTNCVLQEWRGVRGGETKIAFSGKLRDLALQLAVKVADGDTEILRPQLLYALPFSNCTNTSWGTIRGWNFPTLDFENLADKKIKQSTMLKAYTWVMGINKKTPKVGLNAAGNRFIEPLTNEEMDFVMLAGGSYDIKLVRHRLLGNIEGRIDEIELSSHSFYSTGFPGSRSTVIFDAEGISKLIIQKGVDPEHMSTDTVGGENPKDRPIPTHTSFGGSTVYGHEDREKIDLSSALDESRRDPKQKRIDSKENVEEEEKKRREEEYESGEDDPQVQQAKEESLREFMERNKLYIPEVGTEHGTVKVAKEPLIKLNRKATVYPDDNGCTYMYPAVDVNGKELKLWGQENPYFPPEGRCRGHLLATPGDGRCGIHAIVQDLLIRGYADPRDKDLVFARLLEQSLEKTWHTTEDLAQVCHTLGLGMVSVQENNKYIMRYGTKGAPHNVWVHMNKEGNHYSTFFPDEKGDFEIDGYRVAEGTLSPAMSKTAILLTSGCFAGNEHPDAALIQQLAIDDEARHGANRRAGEHGTVEEIPPPNTRKEQTRGTRGSGRNIKSKTPPATRGGRSPRTRGGRSPGPTGGGSDSDGGGSTSKWSKGRGNVRLDQPPPKPPKNRWL